MENYVHLLNMRTAYAQILGDNDSVRLSRCPACGLPHVLKTATVSGLRTVTMIREHQRYTRLLPGTTITVRPNESIDAERKDNRIYTGVVDQDVRGDNGQVAVPRGSTVELIVRVERTTT